MSALRGRVTMSAQDLLAALPDASAGILVTDPPWKLTGGGRFSTVADYDLLSVKEVVKVLEDAHRVLLPGAHAYVFVPSGNELYQAANLFEAHGWPVLRTLAWGKGDAAGLGAWRNAWEPVLVLSNGKSRGFVGTRCKYGSLLMEKPSAGRTAKPWRVYAKMLEVDSLPGELAVDPFCGTNPLGRACQRMGRGQPWVAGDVLSAVEVADSVKNRQWRRSGEIGKWGTYDRSESDASQARLFEPERGEVTETTAPGGTT